ncbi:MAG: hypothetical protein ACRELX_08110, partial [Longimicrobiales bacterium]
ALHQAELEPIQTRALQDTALQREQEEVGVAVRNVMVAADPGPVAGGNGWNRLTASPVLLAGSGLMIRSALALRSIDPGFDRPEDVLTLRLSIPSAEVPEPEAVAAMHERILRTLDEVPGVASVGLSSSITMDGWDSNDPVDVEEFPVPAGQLAPIRRFKRISPDLARILRDHGQPHHRRPRLLLG